MLQILTIGMEKQHLGILFRGGSRAAAKYSILGCCSGPRSASVINKHFGDYHDLYVQSDTLLLADVFDNFRNMCIKVYDLDPAHFYLHLD